MHQTLANSLHENRLNPLHPDRMSVDERRAELAALLALGLVRLRSRQSSRLSAGAENGSVDFAVDQSGHATAIQRRQQ
jgi:hypothetical protein